MLWRMLPLVEIRTVANARVTLGRNPIYQSRERWILEHRMVERRPQAFIIGPEVMNPSLGGITTRRMKSGDRTGACGQWHA